VANRSRLADLPDPALAITVNSRWQAIRGRAPPLSNGPRRGLDEDVLVALQLQPTRGALDAPVPTDPTIYRFYEVLQVYGPTIKELIHEEFGDGIMSAINFRLDVRRAPDPAGDRVVVVLDGKFLPYQW
jgi:cyanase